MSCRPVFPAHLRSSLAPRLPGGTSPGCATTVECDSADCPPVSTCWLRSRSPTRSARRSPPTRRSRPNCLVPAHPGGRIGDIEMLLHPRQVQPHRLHGASGVAGAQRVHDRVVVSLILPAPLLRRAAALEVTPDVAVPRSLDEAVHRDEQLAVAGG